MNATSALCAFTPNVHPAQYTQNPNPAVTSGSMSPPSQSPYTRILPGAEPVNGGHPLPVYSTQEVPRHSVPMGAAPLRQHNGPQNTRPAENVADHPHFQYNRNHPPPLQIPPSSAHSVNQQQLFTPNNHHHPNPPPSVQSHPPFPMPTPDRSSPANFPQNARRQSDPSHPSPALTEKPQTPTQPAFDPLIISATDIALAPVRSALDTVWTLSVNNMRLAMNKMNNDFTYLATQERHRNAHLVSKVTSIESHLQAARQDVQVLRKERQELQNILQAYKEQNRKLQSEKEHWEIERRVLMEGRRGESDFPQVDMNKVLGAVTEQVSKQMEQKMTAILNQIEEQKSSRTQAERRFSETLQNLSDIHNRDSAERSPIVQQSSASPNVLAQSPSLRRGSHSPASTCVVSPIPSKAKPPTTAPHGGVDGASTPISPTDCRSMTPATILQHSIPVPTLAEVHAGDPPSAVHNPPTPTHNLLRRTSSFDEQPRKKPRLTNEREDECPTPIPLSPAVVNQPEVTKSDDNPEPPAENVPSEMEICEPEGDEEGPFSGSVTIKPEPLETKIGIEGSKEATPSSPPSTRATPAWTPVRKPTPKPMPHRAFISNALPANQRNTKLGIGHIDLLYRTDNGVMTCRMCLSRSRDLLLSRDRSSKVAPVMKFEQTKATWDELITHCRSDHPKTCRDLEKLGPTQIAEMKQRLMSGEKSTIPRS